MSRSLVVVVVVALACVAVACTLRIPEGRLLCMDDSDCPGSWVCEPGTSRCVAARPDGGAGTCGAGSMPGAGGCVDLDECLAQDACGHGELCTNFDPGYSCACAPGYVQGPSGSGCTDVDECVDLTGSCDWLGSCVDAEGGYSCACPGGFADQDHRCVSTCVPATDPDGASRTIPIGDATFQSPGVDLDGIDNGPSTATPPGLGPTLAGCYLSDFVGGAENSWRDMAEALRINASVDLDQSLSDAVKTDAFPISFTITKLSSPNSADDPCIEVTLAIDGKVLTGTGALNDHVLTVVFGSPVRVTLPVNLPPENCDSQLCHPAELPMALRGVRARLELDATNTTLVSGTIAGWMFVSDASAAYVDANPEGYSETLRTYLAASNLNESTRSAFEGLAMNLVDLHATSELELAVCTTQTDIWDDRNSLSVAIKLSP